MNKEKQLLASILDKLHAKTDLPNYKLTPEDLSADDFYLLLNSKHPDIALTTLYLIPFLPKETVDLGKINHSTNSAKNYANYYLTEKFNANSPASEILCKIKRDSIVKYKKIETYCSDFRKQFPQKKPIPEIQTPVTSMTIFIHGTWGRTSHWWQQSSDFWNYINDITQNAYSGDNPYDWSGKNDHHARIHATQALADWTNNHPCKKLTIIAHSHGGNISLLASHGIKIHKLILLGTPIRLEYIPKLENIDKIYNIFSPDDLTQKLATFPSCRGEGRTLGDSLRIENLIADDNGQKENPGHSELHDTSTWKASRLYRILEN